jgi:hypothetical protein
MSFMIGGVTWTPKTVREYALAMLEEINVGRIARGEEPLSASTDNAVWIILLAVAAEKADLDTTLNTAIANALNPSLCDDAQILNLLTIAGTALIPASYTTAVLTVVALAAGSVSLVGGTSKLKYVIGGVTVYFVVDDNITIAASGTASVPVTCDTAGAIVLPSGVLIEFDSPITNLSSVTNAAGVTGREVETVAEVRRRIIAGNTISSGLEGTMLAIKALEGITECKIWFNLSRSATLTLTGGQVIPARTAYIVIAGASDFLAETFLSKMLVSTVGAHTQTWLSAAGQSIPVKYDVAANQTAYVKVFYDDTETFDPGMAELIKDIVVAHQNDMKIGETLTAQEVCAWFADFSYGTIVTAEVSLNGSTWADIVYFDADSIPLFSVANVTVAAYA